jgi:hypothetical protein
MLNKNIFVNITSNSYSKFLNYTNSKSSSLHPDPLERAISIHYKTAFLQRKNQNWVQLCLFYALALFFAFCAVLIYSKTPNFNCGIYFKNCEIVKNSVDFLCVALSLAALAIGSRIRPKTEALNHLAYKIQQELNDSSCHIQIELNSLFHDLVLQKQSELEPILIQQ